jgi:uncharacterized delta-60 repeat protein
VETCHACEEEMIGMRRTPTWGLWVTLTLIAMSVPALRGPAAATSGDLDPSFRNDGTLVTNITPWNEDVGDMAIQRNGRIVVVGRASTRQGYGRFAVVRYRTDGALDRRFGGDGIVTTDLTAREDAATGVAIQSDGKIVVVGTATGAHGWARFAVVRYERNGALDGTFGDDGSVTVRFAAGGDDVARDVAIGPDGRIVVVGTALALHAIALARIDASGGLDPTFDGDGKVTWAPGDEFASGSAVALQPDGRIVVAGQSWTESAFDGVVVLRFEPEGTLDEAFGIDGVTTAEFTAGTDGGGDGAGGVALQPDGKIVVAGDAGGPAEYTSRFGLARFGDDGVLDATFGGDGTVRTNFTKLDDSARDLAIQPDGKIVAVGVAGFGWGSLSTFALARFEADGSLDGTFGDAGKLRTPFGGAGPGDLIDILGARAAAVELQPDGRIVVAGEVDRANVDRLDGRFAVARYRA